MRLKAASTTGTASLPPLQGEPFGLSHADSVFRGIGAERIKYTQIKNYNILFKQLFLICYGVCNKKENRKKKLE